MAKQPDATVAVDEPEVFQRHKPGGSYDAGKQAAMRSRPQLEAAARTYFSCALAYMDRKGYKSAQFKAECGCAQLAELKLRYGQAAT